MEKQPIDQQVIGQDQQSENRNQILGGQLANTGDQEGLSLPRSPLQMAANRSERVMQLKALQAAVQNSPQVGETMQRQARVTNSPVMQRTIKIAHQSEINTLNGSQYDKLVKKLEAIAGRKKKKFTNTGLQKRIQDKLDEMIQDTHVYDVATNKYAPPNSQQKFAKKGYEGAVNLAWRNLGNDHVININSDEDLDVSDLEQPEYNSNGYNSDDYNSKMLGKFPKMNDQMIEDRLNNMTKDNDKDDFLTNYKSNVLDPFVEESRNDDTLSSQIRMISDRNYKDKNDLQLDDQKVSHGWFDGNITNRKGHFVKPLVGKGKPYKELCSTIKSLLTTMNEEQYATIVLRAIEGGDSNAFFEMPKPLAQATDELLSVLRFAEMSRGGIAMESFMSSLNMVKNGMISIESAFNGTEATFIGANEKGAQLLRNKRFLGLPKQYQKHLYSQILRGKEGFLHFLKDRRVNIGSPTFHTMMKANHRKYLKNTHKLGIKRKSQIRNIRSQSSGE